MSSTLDNSTPGPGASIEPAAPSTNTKSRKTNVGRRMTSKNNLKNKSRQSKPLKPPRKRSKDDDSIPSSKVDAQVVEKALLVNVNRASSSPSVRQTSKRVGSHRDELDIQSQPAPKRQRLDSIWRSCCTSVMYHKQWCTYKRRFSQTVSLLIRCRFSQPIEFAATWRKANIPGAVSCTNNCSISCAGIESKHYLYALTKRRFCVCYFESMTWQITWQTHTY